MKDSHFGLLNTGSSSVMGRRLSAYEKDPATLAGARGRGRSGLEIDMDESTTVAPLAESRIDGCPTACGNTEPPLDTEPTADGFLATYLCTDCGHRWITSWKVA